MTDEKHDARSDHPEGLLAAAAVAVTPAEGVGPLKESHEANAHLIAAAPQLKDGCNALIGLIQIACLRDDMPPAIKKVLLCSHRMDEALEALRKAEGK